MAYSTFLLDLDHTLLDSDASEDAAYTRTLQAAGVDDPEPFKATYQEINLALWARVEHHELTPQEVRYRRFEDFADAIGIDANPIQMADDFVEELGANGDLYDGALDILKALSQSASLALVTNGIGEVQRARIERLGIGRYFDAIVISAEVNAAKPGAKIFDLAFDGLGSPARESAVMVGDSLASDIRGGANYGIATCWYNPHGKETPEEDIVTHEIAALGELSRLVAF